MTNPLIKELPEHLFGDHWVWSPAQGNLCSYKGVKDGWWFGTDENGVKWLTKLSGSNYAYREHVFSALAQAVGISCQSSVYLTIPKTAIPLRRETSLERFQLALWIIPNIRTIHAQPRAR